MTERKSLAVKQHMSMPNTLTVVSSSATTKGSFSAFLLPSNSTPTITEMIIDGVDMASDMSIFPEDSIIPCNVQSVTVSSGNVILFN